MKKCFFLLTVLLFLRSTFLFAIDTTIKGFIAVEGFNYKKIERAKDSIGVGIGVLDLKFFAEQDDLSASIKLDIDGNLSLQNNLFEEALVSYKGFKNLKLSLGKGVVKFQNLHWGAILNSYQDGGTILETENSFRKINTKALFAATYGNKETNFSDTFTLWGDSQEIQYDEKINPKFQTSGGSGTSASPKLITAYETKPVRAFTTQKQLGLANKFEYYHNEFWTLTLGQVYYKNKQQDKASYGFDLGLNYNTKELEVWLEALSGFTCKSPYDSYATYRKKESMLQAGFQYRFTEKWSFLTNFEILYLEDLAYTYNTFSFDNLTYYKADPKIDKNGQKVMSTSKKLEFAGQYKLSKSSFLTNGIMFENKTVAKNGIKNLTYIPGVYNPNTKAFQILSSIAFWF